MSHEALAYNGDYDVTDDGDVVPLDGPDAYGYQDERDPYARKVAETQEQWHREGVTEADTVIPDGHDGQKQIYNQSAWEDIGSRRKLTSDERRQLATQGIGIPREVARAKDVQFYADRGICSVTQDTRTGEEKQRAHAAYLVARDKVAQATDANKKSR